MESVTACLAPTNSSWTLRQVASETVPLGSPETSTTLGTMPARAQSCVPPTTSRAPGFFLSWMLMASWACWLMRLMTFLIDR